MFRSAVQACDAAFQPLSGWSLLDELSAAGASRLNRTGVAQPALFAVQVGLTELWRHRGVQPDVIVGHSVGEIAAAWAAGALSLDDAVRVVFYRGHLVATMAGPGRMAVVGLSREETEALEACRAGRYRWQRSRAPNYRDFRGGRGSGADHGAELTARDVFVRGLFMAHPFHGPPMEPVREALVRETRRNAAPGATHASVLVRDGRAGQRAIHGATYWGRNLREPVIFTEAWPGPATPESDFLEIGPHPVLSMAVGRALGDEDVGRVVGSLDREVPARRQLRRAFATLHARGHQVSWEALNAETFVPVDLPTNPWINQPCWVPRSGRPGPGRSPPGGRERGPRRAPRVGVRGGLGLST